MGALGVIFWTALAFVCGAIPFSVLIGRLALNTDIRTVGDHNPGATNVLRAGGSLPWFVAAFLLDFFKGMVPVGFAHFIAGIDGWYLVPIAVAPVAGHAFSPFLNFQGGKAVAATFGIWAGLTLGEVPSLLGLFLLLMFVTVDSSSWAVMLAMLFVLLHLLLNHNTDYLLGVWFGNMAILAYKHRTDLTNLPQLSATLPRLLRMSA